MTDIEKARKEFAEFCRTNKDTIIKGFISLVDEIHEERREYHCHCHFLDERDATYCFYQTSGKLFPSFCPYSGDRCEWDKMPKKENK